MRTLKSFIVSPLAGTVRVDEDIEVSHRQASWSRPSQYTLALIHDHAAVVAPETVIEEYHLIKGHACLFLQYREMGVSLIANNNNNNCDDDDDNG